MDSVRLAIGFAIVFVTAATPPIIFSLWFMHRLFPSPNTDDPGPK